MKPNCLKCQHFQITWEPSHPRSCLVFGFKGQEMPSETVKKTTGRECPMYTPKPMKEKNR